MRWDVTKTKYTAITRNKPSRPLQYLLDNNLIQGKVLDYGCGRGFDADYINAAKYDPNWHDVKPVGRFDTITCIYVLNTVPVDIETQIIKNVKQLLTPKGKAYFAVRRDKNVKNKQRLSTPDLDLIMENASFALFGL